VSSARASGKIAGGIKRIDMEVEFLARRDFCTFRLQTEKYKAGMETPTTMVPSTSKIM
jgi:hypothetical protein